jgi:hypothetical protein
MKFVIGRVSYLGMSDDLARAVMERNSGLLPYPYTRLTSNDFKLQETESDCKNMRHKTQTTYVDLPLKECG